MTVSLNGVFSTVNQSGGYTMESDCTGTLTDAQGNAVAKLTMVHGNDEVLGISVVPGSHVALHFERVASACSNATLKGLYGFQRNGVTGTGPLLAIGTITFDGNGGAIATQTIERGGVIGAPVTTTGGYTVNGDCTGSHVTAAGDAFAYMVVVHGGDEALAMSLTPTNNVVVHYERTK